MTSPSGTSVPFTHRQILIIFSGLMAGLLLAAFDQTIVATALPAIVGELGGLDHYSWVVTAYLLSSTVCTPLYGRISDLYGRRVTFQGAILIFLFGSLLAGVAQSMLQLILFRGIQGIGAGGLMAMTFAVVGDVVSPRQRGRYIGYLAGVWAFASVIGPLVGGFIVDHTSWRWIFLINLPVGAAALVVTSSVLRLPVMHRRARIDIEGAALLITGVSCLLLALVWGGTEYPWESPVIVGLAVGGTALTVAFLAWEGRAQEPLLPLRLFSNPIFSVSSTLSFLIGCALFGGVVFLPLFLQVVTGVSATNSGLLILPLTAGIVAGSVGSGWLTTSTGHYKVFPIGGMALVTVGMYLLSLMQAETPWLESSGYMVLLGLGLGMVMQVSLLAIQNVVDYRDLSVATSSAQFFRLMGGSFGVAFFGAIMNTQLAIELPARIPAEVLARVSGEVSQLLNSPVAIRELPAPVAVGIVGSLEAAIQAVFFSAVPIMAGGFALSLFLKEIQLRETVGPTQLVEGASEPAMVDEPSGPELRPSRKVCVTGDRPHTGPQ